LVTNRVANAFRGHPRAWALALPWYTNQRVNGICGNLPRSQAVKLPAANSGSEYIKKRSFYNEAAQKQKAGPSTRNSS
jgi:hypothetical protein